MNVVYLGQSVVLQIRLKPLGEYAIPIRNIHFPGVKMKEQKKHLITFFCMASLYYTASALYAQTAGAADLIRAGEKPLNISTSAENPNEIRGKEAVMSRLETLFSDRDTVFRLSRKKFSESTPDLSIIKGSDGHSIILYTFRYIKASTASEALDSIISPTGVVELIEKSMEDAPHQNTVMIRDIDAKIPEIREFLLALDKPQPQVLVEAQIIEVYIEQGAQRDVKINYTHTDPTTGTTDTYWINNDSPGQSSDTTQGGAFSFFPIASTSGNGKTDTLNLAMRLLNTSNDARILAAPNILADQGITASIETGEDLPIPSSQTTTSSTNLSFEYKRTGVSLKITPRIINKDTVQMEVAPQVTTAIRYQTFTQNELVSVIPVISVRNITTRLTVMDGSIIALGGLYSTEHNETLRKVPYISDIPILGDFFTGRDTKIYDKQLIFFMKIHVMPTPENLMPDLEKTAQQIQDAADILKGSDSIFKNKPPVDRFDLETEMNNTAKEEIEVKQTPQTENGSSSAEKSRASASPSDGTKTEQNEEQSAK